MIVFFIFNLNIFSKIGLICIFGSKMKHLNEKLFHFRCLVYVF